MHAGILVSMRGTVYSPCNNTYTYVHAFIQEVENGTDTTCNFWDPSADGKLQLNYNIIISDCYNCGFFYYIYRGLWQLVHQWLCARGGN